MTSQLAEQRAISKSDLYNELASQLSSLLAANAIWLPTRRTLRRSYFIPLPDLNWAGFYFVKAGELVLGPFQGKPALYADRLRPGRVRRRGRKCVTTIVPNVQ